MRCELCGARAVHRHHLIPKQQLRNRGLQHLLTDPRNLMELCFDCHFGHENWSRHGAARIRRDQLPKRVWAFARMLGEWAVVRLEREYPVRDHDARPAAANGT